MSPSLSTPLNWLKKIGHMGIQKETPYHLVRRLLVTNYASLGHIALAVPHLVMLLMMKAKLLGILVVPLILCSTMVPILNSRGRIYASRHTLLFSTNLAVTFYASSMGSDSSVSHLFFYCLVAPMLFFHVSEWRHMVPGFGIPIAFSLAMLLMGNGFIPRVSVDPDALRLFSVSMTITTTLLLIGTCGFLVYNYHNTEIILVKAQKVAEENSRIKDEFLATISHEIRTPLNGLLGMLQVLIH